MKTETFKKLVEVLELKPIKKYPDRFNTAWGIKTEIGLKATIENILKGD